MSARTSGFRLALLAFCALAMALAPFRACPAGVNGGETGPRQEIRAEEPGTSGPSHHKIIDHLEGGLAKAQALLIRYGYAALFLAILVEGFGIPAPGQTLLMAASIDAARGKLSVVWVLAFAIAAAILGNTIGYAIGRWGGHPLLKRLKVQESRLARMESLFARNGSGLLLVARFFDGLRQLNGIVAGLLEMPWRRFAMWNVFGGILWTGVWGLGIYFLGRRMALVHLTFKRLEPVILAFTVAALASLLIYLLWQRRSKKV